MGHTIGEIAERFGLETEGNPAMTIQGLCGLDDDRPDCLSFVSSPKYLSEAAQSNIPAFVTRRDLRITGKVHLYSDDPEHAMARIAEMFAPAVRAPESLVHATAVIGEDSTLGNGVHIGANAVVGNHVRIGHNTRIMAGAVIMDHVTIGDDCVLYPNTTVREHCCLGSRVILQPGAVIGGDGYGYVFRDGEHRKIPQIGNVVIEDDVEIGANSTVDRARFTSTRVGRGTKIDNHVHVAHNVQVGEHCLLVSHVAIGGSTSLGNHVTLAGQVGLVDHIDVTSGVTVLGKSMVSKSIKEKGIYAGSPVQPAAEWRKSVAATLRLAKRR